MTRRKREHGQYHDWQVALAAIATLAAILALSELTDYDPPETPVPPPQQAPDLADRHRAAHAVSRSAPRAAPAPPSTRGGAHKDTSGRSRSSGEAHKSGPVVGQAWADLAMCESTNNPRAVSPGGTYRGLYQFDAATWASVGGTGDPAAAPRAEQLARAQALQAREGWSPWPQCAASLGLLP